MPLLYVADQQTALRSECQFCAHFQLRGSLFTFTPPYAKTLSNTLDTYQASTMNSQFRPLNVLTDFTANPFTFFANAPILLAGDHEQYNAMTIGWGALGNLWGMERPTATVYVAPARHTFEFIENAKYFVIMTFASSTVAEYMGCYSGRDVDKVKVLGLTVDYTPNGSPYFVEATSVMECEIMYAAPLEETQFRNQVPKRLYENFPAGIHSMFIGDVVAVWQKK